MSVKDNTRYTIVLVKNNDNLDRIVDKVTTRVGWNRATELCKKLNEGLGYVYTKDTIEDILEDAALFMFY